MVHLAGMNSFIAKLDSVSNCFPLATYRRWIDNIPVFERSKTPPSLQIPNCGKNVEKLKANGNTGGGGGSRLNFGQGCAAHCFKIAPLARPIFLKMIPLARLISTSKCHELAFSRQNLPNFCILRTKVWKKLGFFTGITEVWHFFDQNCQKVYPCPD